MKKFVAALTTVIAAVGLVLVGVAAPASAHTTGITGSATCDAYTGTWSVTWTLSVGQVPDGVESETTVTSTAPTTATLGGTSGVVSNGALWISVLSADAALHPGVQVRTGSWGPVTFKQTGIAGSVPQAKVLVSNTFSDGTKTSQVGTAYFGATCSTPTPKDAAAAVTITAPTCTSAATLVLGKTTFASWGTPQYTGNVYAVVATVVGDHLFPNGPNVSSDNRTETFTGTLAPQLTEGCVSPPYPTAAAAVSTTPATCTAPQSLVYGTTSHASFALSSTPNGTTGPAPYSVTANAAAQYSFPDGTTSKTFTGTLTGKIPTQSTDQTAPCYTAPPPTTTATPLPPTFTDECGTANDGYSLPSTAGLHYSYTVGDTTTDGVRTVVITAVPDAGYQFPADFTASPWTHVFTDEDCPSPPAVIVVTPSASECDVTNGGTNLTSWVSIQTVDHVSWTIYPVGHPELAVPLTQQFTNEDAGSYTIAADSDAGFILTDANGSFVGTHHEWAVTVIDSVLCQLPTGAVYDAGAAGHPATCTASGATTSGYITLLHVASQHSEGKVKYDIQLDGSSTVQHAGSHATRVTEPAGHYTVTASAVNPGADGINGETVFHVTVAAGTTDCEPIAPTSLAFTGVNDAGVGLALASGMLLLGLGGLYVRRRYGRVSK